MTADRPAHPGVPAAPRTDLLSVSFTIVAVATVRHQVRRHAADAGLAGDDLDDFVLAVHELVTNAVRHGGGGGHLHLQRQHDTLTCEVRDDGGGGTLRPRLPAGDIPGGRGLWLAQHLTAGLMITAGPAGVSATVTVCLTPATTGITPPASVMLAERADTASGKTTAEEGAP